MVEPLYSGLRDTAICTLSGASINVIKPLPWMGYYTKH